MTATTIRLARPEELAAVGALTVTAYQAERLAPEAYSVILADAENRARHTDVIVAVDDQNRLLGAVALVLNGGPYAELALAEDEAEFRMLAVGLEARGRGVGTALIQECLTRARAAGKRRMVLSTGDNMTAAHRRYHALGFRRAPDLDWSPMPEERLLAYVLDLSDYAD
ncbi:MAG: GNAT family N-acetyltransferase [Actinomycetota bacterium]|nr:GNAT family N-acetyltransferase [Actinomycetota bacterium]